MAREKKGNKKQQQQQPQGPGSPTAPLSAADTPPAPRARKKRKNAGNSAAAQNQAPNSPRSQFDGNHLPQTGGPPHPAFGMSPFEDPGQQQPGGMPPPMGSMHSHPHMQQQQGPGGKPAVNNMGPGQMAPHMQHQQQPPHQMHPHQHHQMQRPPMPPGAQQQFSGHHMPVGGAGTYNAHMLHPQQQPMPPHHRPQQQISPPGPPHLMPSDHHRHHPGMHNQGPPPPGQLQHHPGGAPGMGPMNPMKSLPISANKTYSANDRMLFSEENPNAPPAFVCRQCHKEVHDNEDAIFCESNCQYYYHRGCTRLTPDAFYYLKIESFAEWVCDLCVVERKPPLVTFKA